MRSRSNRDALIYISKSLVIAIAASFIFYNSIFGLVPGVGVGIYVYVCGRKKHEQRERKNKLLQFKNMINAMQSSIEAGSSMENALISAGEDMRKLYGDKSEIVREIKKIERKLRLNISFEEALQTMAETCNLGEIYDFTEILSTIRRTGGNTVEIIRNTVSKLTEEIELDAELETMVAAKKLEQQIMVYMPAMIIVFLRCTSDGFMNPLYGCPSGIIIMTVILGINVLADHIGKRIVDIR